MSVLASTAPIGPSQGDCGCQPKEDNLSNKPADAPVASAAGAPCAGPTLTIDVPLLHPVDTPSHSPPFEQPRTDPTSTKHSAYALLWPTVQARQCSPPSTSSPAPRETLTATSAPKSSSTASSTWQRRDRLQLGRCSAPTTRPNDAPLPPPSPTPPAATSHGPAHEPLSPAALTSPPSSQLTAADLEYECDQLRLALRCTAQYRCGRKGREPLLGLQDRLSKLAKQLLL